MGGAETQLIRNVFPSLALIFSGMASSLIPMGWQKWPQAAPGSHSPPFNPMAERKSLYPNILRKALERLPLAQEVSTGVTHRSLQSLIDQIWATQLHSWQRTDVPTKRKIPILSPKEKERTLRMPLDRHQLPAFSHPKWNWSLCPWSPYIDLKFLDENALNRSEVFFLCYKVQGNFFELKENCL